jgi:hypothetical protein
MADSSSDTSANTHHIWPRVYTPGESPADPPSAYTLKGQEKRLLEDIETFLASSFPEEGNLVKERFAALGELGAAVARFPSVRASGNGWGEKQKYSSPVSSNRDSFLESLSFYSPAARPLHLPVRAAGAHCYFIAKIHAFSFVVKLVDGIEAFYKPLRQVIFSIVCTLLTEEVYFSCLEDPLFSREFKSHLIDDLVALWDNGAELCTAEHQSALGTLWTIRDASPPIFGTMDGSSELMRVSLGMDRDWSDFLIAKLDAPETQSALEEFLFGLSFEEIQEVRSRLARFGISAVGHDEVRTFLGIRPAYTMVKSTDPRSIYDFYMERRDMAVYRTHNAVPGPKKTLEEIYLRFRLTQKENS